MFIWKEQKTLTDAMPSLIRRNCWKQCNDCEITWSKNESKFVNMVKTEEGIRYVCDNCAEKYS